MTNVKNRYGWKLNEATKKLTVLLLFTGFHLKWPICVNLHVLIYIYFLHLGNLQTPFSNEIKVSVDSQGGYSLSVGSTTWLMNAPAFATAGGKTYSTDASATDKMVLKGTKTSSGHDNIGHWTSTIFMYELGSTGLQVHLSIVQYESFVIFEQVSKFHDCNLFQ